MTPLSTHPSQSCFISLVSNVHSIRNWEAGLGWIYSTMRMRALYTFQYIYIVTNPECQCFLLISASPILVARFLGMGILNCRTPTTTIPTCILGITQLFVALYVHTAKNRCMPVNPTSGLKLVCFFTRQNQRTI